MNIVRGQIITETNIVYTTTDGSSFTNSEAAMNHQIFLDLSCFVLNYISYETTLAYTMKQEYIQNLAFLIKNYICELSIKEYEGNPERG